MPPQKRVVGGSQKSVLLVEGVRCKADLDSTDPIAYVKLMLARVLGGHHRWLARMTILKRNPSLFMNTPGLVNTPSIVYVGLNPELALYVGTEHNKINESVAADSRVDLITVSVSYNTTYCLMRLLERVCLKYNLSPTANARSAGSHARD
jgi:hypothetical protein